MFIVMKGIMNGSDGNNSIFERKIMYMLVHVFVCPIIHSCYRFFFKADLNFLSYKKFESVMLVSQ